MNRILEKCSGMFFIVLLFILSGQHLYAEKIKVGYFSNPPHIFSFNGKHSGALVSYWEKHLAPEMSVEIEWVGPLPPLRLFKMLEDGEINCVALLSKNPEREKKYDYPEISFRDVNCGLAVLKGSKISKVESASTLEGLKVGFFKDGFIPEVIKKVNVSWDFSASADWKKQSLEKLLISRVEAVFEPDRSTLDYELVQNEKFNNSIHVLDIPGTQSTNYSVFSKKDNGKFLKLYNNAHKKLLASDKNAYRKLLDPLLQKK